jgi:hypothetical protein
MREDPPDRFRSLEIIKEWWKELGIEIQLSTVEGGGLWQSISKAPFDWDFGVWGWSIHDENAILQVFTSSAKGVFSSSGLASAEYDQMFEDQLVELDDAKRVQIIHDMQEYLIENAVEISMWYPVNVQAYWADEWKGFGTEPDGIFASLNSMSFTNVEPVTVSIGELTETVEGITGELGELTSDLEGLSSRLEASNKDLADSIGGVSDSIDGMSDLVGAVRDDIKKAMLVTSMIQLHQ